MQASEERARLLVERSGDVASKEEEIDMSRRERGEEVAKYGEIEKVRTVMREEVKMWNEEVDDMRKGQR